MMRTLSKSIQITSATLSFIIALGFSSAHAEIPENHFVSKPVAPVTVDGGVIVGKVIDGGVKAWLGVPFAAAPINDLRWEEPQPVKPWTGVFNADRLAPECIEVQRPRLFNQYYGAMG